MSIIRFNTTILDGVIEIPRKYLKDITGEVEVIIKKNTPENQEKSIIDELLANPIRAKNFHPIKRDKIYE